MSTRSSYFTLGPLHLYREMLDNRVHLAVGWASYPDFAPPVLPSWRWIDRTLTFAFRTVPWRLWGRRRFKPPRPFTLGESYLGGPDVLLFRERERKTRDHLDAIADVFTPEANARVEAMARDIIAASTVYLCPAIPGGRTAMLPSARTCPWCRRPLTDHEVADDG